MNTNQLYHLKIIKNNFDSSANKNSKLYERLYKTLKTCIHKKELNYHIALPSTRVLAIYLNISRSTVIRVYDFLVLEKLIKPKEGSGYSVIYKETIHNKEIKNLSSPTNEFKYVEVSDKAINFQKNIKLLNRYSEEHIAFRPGLPPLDSFPVQQWKKLQNLYWSSLKFSELNYAQATGLLSLKKSIRNYLQISRNITCAPEQIIVVSGSLQSLYLISNALLNPDDQVMIEDPTFPNVHSIFKSQLANITGVPLDEEGIMINHKKYENTQPKILHVTPANHYPLGIKMSFKRRKKILDWAANKGTYIIENDYENEIANQNEPLPSIFSLDNQNRTIYLGTFNRLLHPSVRLGYMIVPPQLIKPIEGILEHSHRFVSPSLQVVMNMFIEKNYMYQHLKNSIEIAHKRYPVFCKAFEQKIKSMQLFNNPKPESFHVIAEFIENNNLEHQNAMIEALNKKGITALPLSKCYVNEPPKYGLIFGYAAVRTNTILNKMEIMQQILG